MSYFKSNFLNDYYNLVAENIRGIIHKLSFYSYLFL